MPGSGLVVQSSSLSKVTSAGPPHFGSKATVQGPSKFSNLFQRGEVFAGRIGLVARDMRTTEDDETTARGWQRKRHDRAAVFLAELGQIAPRAADSVPQFGLRSSHPEGHVPAGRVLFQFVDRQGAVTAVQYFSDTP